MQEKESERKKENSWEFQNRNSANLKLTELELSIINITVSVYTASFVSHTLKYRWPFFILFLL